MSIISNSSSSVHPLKAWAVPLVAGLFFFYEFIQMNMINSLNPYLMQVFHVGAEQLGALSSFYFIANLIFLFPAGIMLDRFSTRRIILISFGICIVGTLAFSQATDFNWAKAFRFLTGIGSAFCFLSCIRLATRWLEPRHMALASGLIVTMAMLGGSVAQAPMTLLIQATDWRTAVLLDGGLGLIIFLLIFLVVRDSPVEKNEVTTIDARLTKLGFWRSLRSSYLNWQNWLCGIYTNLLNLPIFILGAIFGSSYLHQTQGISSDHAAFICGLIYFGTVIGSPIAGWISDKLRRRRLPMQFGAVLSLLCLLPILFMPGLSETAFMWLFFLLGLVTSTQIISYPLVAETNHPSLTATSISVISFNAISGGAIFQPLVGALLDSRWGGVLINGHRVYDLHAYQYALSLLVIGLLLAFVFTFFLRESHASGLN